MIMNMFPVAALRRCLRKGRPSNLLFLALKLYTKTQMDPKTVRTEKKFHTAPVKPRATNSTELKRTIKLSTSQFEFMDGESSITLSSFFLFTFRTRKKDEDTNEKGTLMAADIS